MLRQCSTLKKKIKNLLYNLHIPYSAVILQREFSLTVFRFTIMRLYGDSGYRLLQSLCYFPSGALTHVSSFKSLQTLYLFISIFGYVCMDMCLYAERQSWEVQILETEENIKVKIIHFSCFNLTKTFINDEWLQFSLKVILLTFSSLLTAGSHIFSRLNWHLSVSSHRTAPEDNLSLHKHRLQKH